MFEKKIFDTKNLVWAAMLLALTIVLSSPVLSIHTANMKFSFTFIPLIIAARKFGAVTTGVIAGIADIFGVFMAPAAGAFFPGFTVSAVITGIVYGICIHKKYSFIRLLISVLINQLIVSLVLNTYFIAYLSGTPFLAQVYIRLLQTVIMTALQLVIMPLILKNKQITL